jgi:hypothetical protein
MRLTVRSWYTLGLCCRANFYDETPPRSCIALGMDSFVRAPSARSTDERGGISAQIRKGRQETTEIDEEKRQAAAESTETRSQGAAKVAKGGTKSRRQSQPPTPSEVTCESPPEAPRNPRDVAQADRLPSLLVEVEWFWTWAPDSTASRRNGDAWLQRDVIVDHLARQVTFPALYNQSPGFRDGVLRAEGNLLLLGA